MHDSALTLLVERQESKVGV